MAENVALHGELAQLSGPARCNACQAGGHRCVFATGDSSCISCSSAGRECIITRPILVSGPAAAFSWETMVYKEPTTRIDLPSGTTSEQFKDILAPFNPDGPKNAIVRRISHRMPSPPPKPVPTPKIAPHKAATPKSAPPKVVAPKAETVTRQPPSPQDDTIRLQNGAPSSSGKSSSPFPSGTYSFTKDNLESLPNERRLGLRSGLQLENALAKGDACDDCRKHKRKCVPSHKKRLADAAVAAAAATTPPTPVKSTPATAKSTPGSVARSSSTQRFPCTYSECGRDFTFMGDLQRHTREIHGVDLDGNPVEPHYCPIEDCGRHVRPFARRDNLRQHLEKRHGMTPEEADNLLVKRPRTGRRSNAS